MKTWKKPMLIILTREAAEAVLTLCKDGAASGVGIASNNISSDYWVGTCTYGTTGSCLNCQTLSAS